jgi:chemotaxis regulatin CheY-phosphate phosphatase CheZ
MSQFIDQTAEREAGAVESVVIALHKVIDLLDRIKTAIEESSNKIPKASVQLSTVTQATEVATVEILNVLDTMTQKVSEVESELPSLRELLGSGPGMGVVETIEKNLSEVKQDSMNIAIALQVQDITAQKIAAANHLIECVRLELMRELNYFEKAGAEVLAEQAVVPPAPPVVTGEVAFDKNASYRKTSEHQERINQVMQEWKQKQANQNS